jgi:hypothetical protein
MDWDEDPIAPLNEPLWFKSKFGEGFEPRLKPLLQAVGPVIDGGIWREHVFVQFEFRPDDVNEPSDVSSARQVVAASRQFDVLLRNTPSPALRMGDFIRRV